MEHFVFKITTLKLFANQKVQPITGEAKVLEKLK